MSGEWPWSAIIVLAGKTTARSAKGGSAICSAGWIAQRARTAREGVTLAGGWIEQFGYVDSGRTYVIADPHEAWLLAVVNGRHWVARRVADDEVVVLPNVYVTDTVDLSDAKNFLGSGDLIDYATGRGWFDRKGASPSVSIGFMALLASLQTSGAGRDSSLSAARASPGRRQCSHSG